MGNVLLFVVANYLTTIVGNEHPRINSNTVWDFDDYTEDEHIDKWKEWMTHFDLQRYEGHTINRNIVRVGNYYRGGYINGA